MGFQLQLRNIFLQLQLTVRYLSVILPLRLKLIELTRTAVGVYTDIQSYKIANFFRIQLIRCSVKTWNKLEQMWVSIQTKASSVFLSKFQLLGKPSIRKTLAEASLNSGLLSSRWKMSRPLSFLNTQQSFVHYRYPSRYIILSLSFTQYQVNENKQLTLASLPLFFRSNFCRFRPMSDNLIFSETLLQYIFQPFHRVFTAYQSPRVQGQIVSRY